MNWLERHVSLVRSPGDFRAPERFSSLKIGELPSPLQAVYDDYVHHFWTHAPLGKAPLLVGRAFTWKTAAACLICLGINRRYNVGITFVSVPDQLLFLELDRFSHSTRQTIQRWIDCPFLAFDDFTAVEPKSFGHQVLQAVFANRFSNQRPTLWTGNIQLDPKDPFTGLGLAYGPLMGRRWQQAAAGFTILTG